MNDSVVPSRSPWGLRSALFLIVAILVVAGVLLHHTDVGAISTTSSTTAHSSTTLASSNLTTTTITTTSTTTPTSILTSGVVATAPTLGRTPSHCPLTLALRVAHPGTKLDLTPRRCTVLEIGDSLGNDLGWGLQRQLSGYPWLHLIQKDKSSSGLANSWFFSWPVHFEKDIRQYHPNLVIVCLGGDDEQNFKVNGVYETVGTPAWRATYSRYVRQIVGLARAARVQVLWVGLPVMQPNYYSQGVAMLNSLYVGAIRHIPGTAYVPTWKLFATSEGTYMGEAQVNGVAEQLRASDGIHFSEVGENVVSTYVVHELSVLFHLPLFAAESATITADN